MNLYIDQNVNTFIKMLKIPNNKSQQCMCGNILAKIERVVKKMYSD